MSQGSIPFRTRVANRVFDVLKKAAVKAGIAESVGDRFVLRSILMPSGERTVRPRHKSKVEDRKGKQIHVVGARRAARQRQKASRQEQRRKGVYGRPQA